MGEVLVNESGIILSAQSFRMLWSLNALRDHSLVLSLCDCSHIKCVLSDTTQMH